MKKSAFQTSTALLCLVASTLGVNSQSLPTVTSGTLRLWLKADAGVSTNGSGFVSQWQDQSAQTNHASQANANQQPKLIGNALNGQPVIRFDGVQDATFGDCLHGTGDVGLGSGFTSFVIYKLTDASALEQLPLLVGVLAQFSSTREHYIYGDQMAFGAWANDYGSGFLIPTNIYRLWTLRLNATKTLVDFFDTDNVSNFTVSVGTGGLLTPGAGYYVGGLAGEMRNFKGDIAELIVFQGALTEPDRLAVENYLKARYWSGPPVIVTQPQGQSVAAGSNVVFSVGASGITPFHYQWRFNDTDIADATNLTVTISNAQPANEGNYLVVVTNAYGATTSSVAGLTVTVPITITTQPQSQAVLAGTNVTFSVTVTGDAPQFQWLRNSVAIADATNAALTLTNVQATNAGNYAVVVTNGISSVLSSNAVLTINELPMINLQPQGRTVLVGETVSLTVGIQGAFPQVNSGVLRLWLKADAGVVADGSGLISQWLDQSAFGNSCVQTNTNKQPVLTAAALNGRPVVRFDGIQNSTTGDYLQGTGSLNIPAGFTSFLVYKLADASALEQLPLLVGVLGQSSSTRSHYISGRQMAFGTWGNDYGSGFLIPTNIYRIWTLRMNAAKTLLDFFDTDTVSNFTASVATGGLLTPGAGYYIGGLGSQTRNFKGDIAELLVYDAALTEGERMSVENYLRDRYSGVPGGGSFSFQWQMNGTNLPGATNATLTLTNLQPNQSGNYTVIVTNGVGSVTSQVATVRALYLFPKVGGQRLTNSAYTYISSTTVSFESYFTNGSIFYTLNGSTPTFASTFYTGPFAIQKNSVLRAIAYSSDFTKSGQSDPVTFTIVPLYTLTTGTPGGGNVSVNPTPGPYVSGTNVTVSATASNGWTFLGWLGDLSGTNLTNTVTMTRNKSVSAIFGTTFNATTPGSGSVLLTPQFALYPYGSAVRLTAVPQPGNFFGVWGNAASGNINPLSVTITNANATVSALFSSLGVNQFSLTLLTVGGGQVSASPRSNSYAINQSVTLTATPEVGQSFLGWSGDAGGTQNPLSVSMTASKTITASFSGGLRLFPASNPDGFRITMTNLTAGQYAIEETTNFVDWNSLIVLTNTFGILEFTDPGATNSERGFYRALEIQP